MVSAKTLVSTVLWEGGHKGSPPLLGGPETPSKAGKPGHDNARSKGSTVISDSQSATVIYVEFLARDFLSTLTPGVSAPHPAKPMNPNTLNHWENDFWHDPCCGMGPTGSRDPLHTLMG